MIMIRCSTSLKGKHGNQSSYDLQSFISGRYSLKTFVLFYLEKKCSNAYLVCNSSLIELNFFND